MKEIAYAHAQAGGKKREGGEFFEIAFVFEFFHKRTAQRRRRDDGQNQRYPRDGEFFVERKVGHQVIGDKRRKGVKHDLRARFCVGGAVNGKHRRYERAAYGCGRKKRIRTRSNK